jgi:hypothetical protein
MIKSKKKLKNHNVSEMLVKYDIRGNLFKKYPGCKLLEPESIKILKFYLEVKLLKVLSSNN